jgi:glycolate oxidase
LKLGSCAVSDNWFTRGPIPDIVGLFTSACGRMGIVTKLSVKLFPKHEFREVVIGLMKNTEYIPQLVTNLTKTDIPEDLMVAVAEKPDFMKGYAVLLVYITGDDEDEMKSKTKMLKRLYRKNKATYMKLPPRYYDIFLEQPQFAAKAADFRKGGGFEYVGSFMPLEKIPDAIDRARDISLKYDIVPTQVSRIIGRGHAVMFAASYSFNRADLEDMERARKALHETNEMVLELGGIPWKSELAGQKMILEHMDPNYKKVLKSIRMILDPNGIMNPGNWEVS